MNIFYSRNEEVVYPLLETHDRPTGVLAESAMMSDTCLMCDTFKLLGQII